MLNVHILFVALLLLSICQFSDARSDCLTYCVRQSALRHKISITSLHSTVGEPIATARSADAA